MNVYIKKCYGKILHLLNKVNPLMIWVSLHVQKNVFVKLHRIQINKQIVNYFVQQSTKYPVAHILIILCRDKSQSVLSASIASKSTLNEIPFYIPPSYIDGNCGKLMTWRDLPSSLQRQRIAEFLAEIVNNRYSSYESLQLCEKSVNLAKSINTNYPKPISKLNPPGEVFVVDDNSFSFDNNNPLLSSITNRENFDLFSSTKMDGNRTEILLTPILRNNNDQLSEYQMFTLNLAENESSNIPELGSETYPEFCNFVDRESYNFMEQKGKDIELYNNQNNDKHNNNDGDNNNKQNDNNCVKNNNIVDNNNTTTKKIINNNYVKDKVMDNNNVKDGGGGNNNIAKDNDNNKKNIEKNNNHKELKRNGGKNKLEEKELNSSYTMTNSQGRLLMAYYCKKPKKKLISSTQSSSFSSFTKDKSTVTLNLNCCKQM